MMTNIQAIDLLKGLEQSLDDYYGLNDEGKTAFQMAITALELFGNTEQLPSAQQEFSGGLYVDGYNDGYRDGMKDAQPEREKGEWIVTSEFEDCRYVKCNQCKVTQVFYHNKPLTNFCPNCGAKMEG